MGFKKDKCRICVGRHWKTINALIRDGRPLNNIAREFELKADVVKRHATSCDITRGELDTLKHAYEREEGRPLPGGIRLPSSIEAKRVDLNVSTVSENIKVL